MKNILTFILFCTTIVLAQENLEPIAIKSLRNIFGDSISVTPSIFYFNKEDKDSLYKRSKEITMIDSLPLYFCSNNDTIIGYGIVDKAKGRMHYFTYLVTLTINDEIKDIDILEYPGSHGGEIADESFRKQFRQKTISDKLQAGKDIKTISGATISGRSITNGVKKILIIFNYIRNRLN